MALEIAVLPDGWVTALSVGGADGTGGGGVTGRGSGRLPSRAEAEAWCDDADGRWGGYPWSDRLEKIVDRMVTDAARGTRHQAMLRATALVVGDIEKMDLPGDAVYQLAGSCETMYETPAGLSPVLGHKAAKAWEPAKAADFWSQVAGAIERVSEDGGWRDRIDADVLARRETDDLARAIMDLAPEWEAETVAVAAEPPPPAEPIAVSAPVEEPDPGEVAGDHGTVGVEEALEASETSSSPDPWVSGHGEAEGGAEGDREKTPEDPEDTETEEPAVKVPEADDRAEEAEGSASSSLAKSPPSLEPALSETPVVATASEIEEDSRDVADVIVEAWLDEVTDQRGWYRRVVDTAREREDAGELVQAISHRGRDVEGLRRQIREMAETEIVMADEIEPTALPHWIGDFNLPRGEIVPLVGHPSTGKTVQAVAMCCRLALGLRWHDAPVTQTGSIIFAFESFESVKRRVMAWCQEHHDDVARAARADSRLVGGDGLPTGLMIVKSHVSLTDPVAGPVFVARTVEEYARRMGGRLPGVVVVDTLAAAFGDGDENSARDMGAVVAGLRLAEKTAAGGAWSRVGATFIPVHHPRKDASRGEAADLRGSGALTGTAATIWSASRPVELAGGAGGLGIVQVERTKAKDGPVGARVWGSIKVVELMGRDGRSVVDEYGAVATVPVWVEASMAEVGEAGLLREFDLEGEITALAERMLEESDDGSGSGRWPSVAAFKARWNAEHGAGEKWSGTTDETRKRVWEKAAERDDAVGDELRKRLKSAGAR